jgi:hypothetical protein
MFVTSLVCLTFVDGCKLSSCIDGTRMGFRH